MLNLDVISGRTSAQKFLKHLNEASIELGVQLTPRYYRK